MNINGSFLATTADSYIFDNGFAYSASNSDIPPLLTINFPVGLQMESNSASIEVKGNGHNLALYTEPTTIIREDISRVLEVKSGNTLAFLAGEINLTGGNLTAESGNIELGSVAQSNHVTIVPQDNGLSFGYEATTEFADINLIKGASIDVSGNGGGKIRLQGKNVYLLEESVILNHTLGGENGNDTTINATDSLNIIGVDEDEEVVFPSSIIHLVGENATGNSGDIKIDTKKLQVSQNAFILNNTLGDGDGGNLEINADRIEISQDPFNQGYFTGLFTETESGKGNGGSIDLNAREILLSDLTLISSSTFNEGKGGNLTITTDNLLIEDGSSILLLAVGAGDAGNLSISATTVEIKESFFPSLSGIFTDVLDEATGKGGSASILADSLILQDEGEITAGSSEIQQFSF